MVSQIVPGSSAGANALGVDPRLARRPTAAGVNNEDKNPALDRVEISGAAALAGARESVANGLANVQEALQVARDGQTMLLKAQALAGDPNAVQADLSQALGAFASSLAAAQGNPLIDGGAISVNADPASPALSISGADLSLGGDIIGLGGGASIADGSLSSQAQTGLDRLQGVIDHFGEAASALQAHQGFLGAAQNAVSGVTDLNADSARLLALQVRQGLEAENGRAIANVEPQAVLALFRA